MSENLVYICIYSDCARYDADFVKTFHGARSVLPYKPIRWQAETECVFLRTANQKGRQTDRLGSFGESPDGRIKLSEFGAAAVLLSLCASPVWRS